MKMPIDNNDRVAWTQIATLIIAAAIILLIAGHYSARHGCNSKATAAMTVCPSLTVRAT